MSVLPNHNHGARHDLLGIGEMIVEIMRPMINVPLHRVGEFRGPFPSGAPAIMISAAARAGLSCGFAGSVGHDDFGRCLMERLRADGVELNHVREMPHLATGCAFVTYFDDGSRQFIFHIANTGSDQIEAGQDLESYAAGFRHLHLMGCTLTVSARMREACFCAARAVKQAGGTVSFDPNLRPELLGVSSARQWLDPLVELVDVLLPSGAEMRLLTGSKRDEEACTRLFARGVRIIAQKLGADGCRIWTPDNQFDVPGLPIDAIDPTGAGDCFDAGFIAGLLEGQPLEDTARLANAMGALGTSRQGPMEGVFSRREIENFMHAHVQTKQGAI